MATVVLGCDRNGLNDTGCQNTIAKALEKAGHTVEKLSIGPNYYAKYSYSKKAKGKIGVFLIAAGLTAIADAYDGNTYFKYNYFGIRADASKNLKTMNDFKTRGIHKDKHGDCISKSCNKLQGKTYPQINEIIKSKCKVVFGTTHEELGNNIVKAMGGEGDSSSSSSDSVSSIKSCIQELLYPWNGEAYCVVRDDTVHIGRIPGPTGTSLSLIEGDNVYFDSISVTDVDSEIPNKLIVKYGGKEYIIKDDVRISRFGEIKKEITAEIKTETDIVDYAYREWNKLLKDSGRVLNCRVDGDAKWQIGKWVRVYLPSFNLDGFMYTTKASHDDNGIWITTLTLKDYPPDLGTEPTNNGTSDSSFDTDTEEDAEE